MLRDSVSLSLFSCLMLPSASLFCDLWLKPLAIRFVATLTDARGTGGALELPQQSGRSPTAIVFLMQFEIKMKSLALMVYNKLSCPVLLPACISFSFIPIPPLTPRCKAPPIAARESEGMSLFPATKFS